MKGEGITSKKGIPPTIIEWKTNSTDGSSPKTSPAIRRIGASPIEFGQILSKLIAYNKANRRGNNKIICLKKIGLSDKYSIEDIYS